MLNQKNKNISKALRHMKKIYHHFIPKKRDSGEADYLDVRCGKKMTIANNRVAHKNISQDPRRGRFTSKKMFNL